MSDAPCRRIVVVEDHADARAALEMVLHLDGHRVRTVGEGREAVDVILAERPDVALIDIGLPGIDGHEVARRVRAAPEGRGLVLIALTGYGRPDDARRAIEAGFDAHLVKPVDVDELGRMLARLGGRPEPDAS
jgi:CheY-like chemotaxis protein